MNTTDFLSISNAICPDRHSMVFGGKRWTYSQLNDRANRLAHALFARGVVKGDRVGILQVNCNQYIESYFASAKLGAIFVPLNFRMKAEELEFMVSNAEAKVLLVGSRYLDMAGALRTRIPALMHCISIDRPNAGMDDYEDLIQSSPSEEWVGEIEDEDISTLMYTTGTSGQPKGVPLRHQAFATYVLENLDPASPEVEETNLLTVPLYHVAGIQAMLAAIYGGRTLVIMSQFDVKEWLETVQREKVTRAMLVPTMLKRVIDDTEFSHYDLSSLKIITYGAAPMPFEVIRKAIQVLPWVRFINAFGQTETASTITVLSPEDHQIEGTEEEQQKKLKRLASSIGRPLPDVELRILDENGKVLPPFQTGEIWAKGPRIMSGYWRDEQGTSQTINPDGWLRTGDMGWMDEEGYLFLAGRADDMIIRGGENISPEEVENVLRSHPKVEDAALIGIPDPEWGQQPRAVLVLKRGETVSPEEIMAFCRDKLAGYKRPKSVVFVESLPRNPMGKVLKRVLRDEYGQPEIYPGR